MPNAADTLFLPLAKGEIPTPDGNWLFLGAVAPENGIPTQFKDKLICVQPMRGLYLDLQMRGLNASAAPPENSGYVGALVLIGKHKRENEALLNQAVASCADGAVILVSGDKTSGIASLKRRVGAEIELAGSLAKYHANVFWFAKKDGLELGFETSFSSPAGFQTAPGMFSAEKIDKGSALLAAFIDNAVQGNVADFGAGWGYLSRAIADGSKARSLSLFEAHRPSLKAAKSNLCKANLPIEYHWHDVTREPIRQSFDWIIMNPPFHTGRKTEPSLGERFIEVAVQCLKPKGTLLLVANSGLPYEKTLSRLFKSQICLARQDGFKVLKAQR